MDMREKFRRFMTGRYGNDKMNQVLSWVSLALVLVGIIVDVNIFYTVGIVLLVYIYYRSFSRNISKRYAENQAFLQQYYRLTGWFTNKKRSMERNKGYRVFACPQCKQKLRVPKGKGKISIHCSKCGNDFIKRS